MSPWKLPSRAEQEKHLKEIGAILGCRVRFRTSQFEWQVIGWLELSPNGSISVLLRSPKTQRQRTAWPWELRAGSVDRS